MSFSTKGRRQIRNHYDELGVYAECRYAMRGGDFRRGRGPHGHGSWNSLSKRFSESVAER